MRWKKYLCCCCGPRSVGPTKNSITLLMLGLDNAGKSSVAKAVCGAKEEEIREIAPTMGFDRNQTLYRGTKIDLFDLGGAASFRDVWPGYFSSTHGFVFVVDSSMSKTRLIECKDVLEKTLTHAQVRGKPVWVVCNKSDEDEAADSAHLVHTLDLERVVNAAQCPTRVDSAAAIRKQNLRTGFKWLIRTVMANMASLGPRVEQEMSREAEQEQLEKERVLQRIRERDEEEEDAISNNSAKFVPLQELRAKWEEEEEKANHNGDNNENASFDDRSKEEVFEGNSSIEQEDLFQRQVIEEDSNEELSKNQMPGLRRSSNNFQNRFDAIQEESTSVEMTPRPNHKHIDVDVIRADTTSSLSRRPDSNCATPNLAINGEQVDNEEHKENKNNEDEANGEDGSNDSTKVDFNSRSREGESNKSDEDNDASIDNKRQCGNGDKNHDEDIYNMNIDDEIHNKSMNDEKSNEKEKNEKHLNNHLGEYSAEEEDKNENLSKNKENVDTSDHNKIDEERREDGKENFNESNRSISKLYSNETLMEDVDAIVPASDDANEIIANPHFNSSANASPTALPPINNSWVEGNRKKKGFLTKLSNKVDIGNDPVKKKKKRNNFNVGTKGSNGFLDDDRVVKIYSQHI